MYIIRYIKRCFTFLATKTVWGTTFSQKYCADLGLDWRQVYQRMLTEVPFTTIRLCTYWDLVEPAKGKFDFAGLDWQIKLAASHKVQVTLAVGRKVPRWPEYHEPSWALSRDAKYLHACTLKMISKVIKRYRGNPAVVAFQIENEPFWNFGPTKHPLHYADVQAEVELARELTSKPLVMTDTGEWSDWSQCAELADRVGVNIYPITYRDDKYVHSRASAFKFFCKGQRFKEKYDRALFVSELQAEPWGPGVVQDLPESEWSKSISLRKLKRNIRLAQRAGFSEVWLWGVEWWYYLAAKGNYSFLDHMKKIKS